MEDVLEILRIKLVGVIPEDQSVLRASNRGRARDPWIHRQTRVKRMRIPLTVCWEKNVLSASLKKRRKVSSNACSEDKLWHYWTFFLSRKKSTANIAKERLQIIVAERRRSDAEPHYLPQLRKDILEVICKYVQIDPEMVTVQLEQKDGDISILELNVTLPEAEESR